MDTDDTYILGLSVDDAPLAKKSVAASIKGLIGNHRANVLRISMSNPFPPTLSPDPNTVSYNIVYTVKTHPYSRLLFTYLDMMYLMCM
jgi:hypothetical protein